MRCSSGVQVLLGGGNKPMKDMKIAIGGFCLFWLVVLMSVDWTATDPYDQNAAAFLTGLTIGIASGGR